jgi:hypothetical protein
MKIIPLRTTILFLSEPNAGIWESEKRFDINGPCQRLDFYCYVPNVDEILEGVILEDYYTNVGLVYDIGINYNIFNVPVPDFYFSCKTQNILQITEIEDDRQNRVFYRPSRSKLWDENSKFSKMFRLKIFFTIYSVFFSESLGYMNSRWETCQHLVKSDILFESSNIQK